MKKTTTLLLLAQITLIAGVADMQTLYHQRKYEAVIAEAQKSPSEYGDASLHLLWAKSAEALGKKEIAMSAYERVLMIDPDNTEVRVHLASLYADLGRDELAAEMSKSTENYQLTPAQRTALASLRRDDLQQMRASAGIAVGYDSNINISPDELDLPTIGKAKETIFTQFLGNLSYTHDLSEKGGWYLRGDADLFYQNNSSAHYYDLLAGSVAAGAGYSGSFYDVYLPVSYGRVHYLDRDLLQSVSVDPRINFTLAPSFILNVNARYTERSYIDKADEKSDVTISGGGLGLFWLFDNNFAYIKANYNNYSADHSDSIRFTDKDTITTALGINYALREWFIARADFRYRYATYDDKVTDSSDDRSDDFYQTDLKVSRIFFDTLEGSLLYRYIKNTSNYAPAEYDKNIVMLGLQYNY